MESGDEPDRILGLTTFSLYHTAEGEKHMDNTHYSTNWSMFVEDIIYVRSLVVKKKASVAYFCITTLFSGSEHSLD